MSRLEEAKAELAELEANPFIEGVDSSGETDMFAACYRNRRVNELTGEIRGLEQAAAA